MRQTASVSLLDPKPVPLPDVMLEQTRLAD
jgi:hypothetical protein